MITKVSSLILLLFVVTVVGRYKEKRHYADREPARNEDQAKPVQEDPLKDWKPVDLRFGFHDSIRCQVYVPRDVHGILKRTWDSVNDDTNNQKVGGDVQSKLVSKLNWFWRSLGV